MDKFLNKEHMQIDGNVNSFSEELKENKSFNPNSNGEKSKIFEINNYNCFTVIKTKFANLIFSTNNLSAVFCRKNDNKDNNLDELNYFITSKYCHDLICRLKSDYQNDNEIDYNLAICLYIKLSVIIGGLNNSLVKFEIFTTRIKNNCKINTTLDFDSLMIDDINDNSTYLESIILRIFKNSWNCIIDRDFEEQIINLMYSRSYNTTLIIESDNDNNPKLYRIEKYLDNHRQLNDNEKIDLEFSDLYTNLLIKGIVNINSLIIFDKCSKNHTSKSVFEQLKYYLSCCLEHIKMCIENNYLDSNQVEILRALILEITNNYKLSNDNSDNSMFQKCKLVLSHNDIHCGNLLINETLIQNYYDTTSDTSMNEKSKLNLSLDIDIKIIDYEFANFNIIGFDIVNYIVECFFDLYYDKYPFFNTKKDFRLLFEDKKYYSIYEKYIKAYKEKDTIDTNFDEKLYLSKEYFFFLIGLSGSFWSVIGVLSINKDYSKSKSEFDFYLYLLKRIEIFHLYLKYSVI